MISDGRIQLLALGTMINNGRDYVSGSDSSNLYPYLVSEFGDNVDKDFGYYDAVMNRLTAQEEKVIRDTNAQVGIPESETESVLDRIKRGINERQESVREQKSIDGEMFGIDSSTWQSVTVIIVGILLLGIAAYSIIVPKEARGDILKLAMKG